jgi:hypothetical protein
MHFKCTDLEKVERQFIPVLSRIGKESENDF